MPPRKMRAQRSAVGLMLHPNPLKLPEGALLEAKNVVIDGPGRISKHRGVNRYGDALAVPAQQVSEFNDKIIFQEGTTLKYDSDDAGTWTSITGTHSPTAADARTRFIESLFSLYFTTSEGVKRLDDLAGTPRLSGMPQGLDTNAVFAGTGLGWFGSGQVAYKLIWIRKDANNQEVTSAPGYREVVTNAKASVLWAFATGTVTITQTAHGYSTGDTVQMTGASEPEIETPTSTITSTGANTYTYTIAGAPTAGGGAADTVSAHREEDVDVTATVPDDVIAGDFYEIYRTQVSANDTTDPGARYLKLSRVEVLAADITAATVDFSDTFGEIFLGQQLYDNPTAEGSHQSNHRPPFAKDIATYKGYTFYANTRVAHFVEIRLVEATGLSNGDTVTIGARTYTTAAAEAIGSQEFLLETGLTTEAENVRTTAKSLVRVINRDTGNSVFYAHYVSGALDAPGRIVIRRRDFTDTAISLTADSTATGDNFEPNLPTAGTTVSTENDSGPNRLYRSKFEQPDAVPETQHEPIGSARDAVLRIVPLRDSLMIFTERMIHRLSGEGEQSFTVRILESAIQLLAPESPAVLNDSVYCYTSEGVTAINENGAEIESFFGIERELNKIQSFSNFKTITWGLGYVADRKYYLFTQDEGGDTTATIAWVLNTITNTWTQRPKKAAAGWVLNEKDVMYLAHAVDARVLKERKSFSTSSSDFADEDIPITIDTVATTTDAADLTVSRLTITYTYTGETFGNDWLIQQGNIFGRVVSTTDNGGNSYTVDLDSFGSYTVAAATASIPIISRVRWAPEVLENPATTKLFPYVTFTMEADTWRSMRVGFVTDVMHDERFVNPVLVALSFGWGDMRWDDPWGDDGPLKSTPKRIPVPQPYRRARWLSTIFEHSLARSAFEIVSLGIVGLPYSERSEA